MDPIEFSLRIPQQARSNDDCQGIVRWIIKKTNLMLTVGRPQLAQLARNFVLYSYEPGEAVFDQGDPGDMFYIVFEGRISIEVNGNWVAEMKKGQVFGDSSLRTASARSAAAVAAHDDEAGTCKVMGLTVYDYHVIMAQYLMDQDKATFKFLSKSMSIAKGWPEFKLKTFVHQSHRQEVS